jgi:hypothetical protein
MPRFTALKVRLRAVADYLVKRWAQEVPRQSNQGPSRRARPFVEELEGRWVPDATSISSLTDLANQLQQQARQGFPNSGACRQSLQQFYDQALQTLQANGIDTSTFRAMTDASLQQGLQNCGRLDKHPGTGSKQTREHADTSLGNRLLLLEGTLFVYNAMSGSNANFTQGSWFWMRDNWIHQVEKATSPAALGRLLVQVEGAISRSAFDASWPSIEAGWQRSVLNANSMQTVTRLLDQLKSHLHLQTITGKQVAYFDWAGALGPTHVPPPIPGQ